MNIPDVCRIDDLCRILKVSRRSIQRARADRRFPIPELDAIDSFPRWAGADVQRYLERRGTSTRLRRVG